MADHDSEPSISKCSQKNIALNTSPSFYFPGNKIFLKRTVSADFQGRLKMTS